MQLRGFWKYVVSRWVAFLPAAISGGSLLLPWLVVGEPTNRALWNASWVLFAIASIASTLYVLVAWLKVIDAAQFKYARSTATSPIRKAMIQNGIEPPTTIMAQMLAAEVARIDFNDLHQKVNKTRNGDFLTSMSWVTVKGVAISYHAKFLYQRDAVPLAVSVRSIRDDDHDLVEIMTKDELRLLEKQIIKSSRRKGGDKIILPHEKLATGILEGWADNVKVSKRATF